MIVVPGTQSNLRRLRKLVCATEHPRLEPFDKKDVDGIRTRACSSSEDYYAASRVYPTCGDKPGHDGGEWPLHHDVIRK